MRVKVARRYQITIPEEVRGDAGINIGDTLDVRSQDGKVIIEKIGRDWETVMEETRGAWKTHPSFKETKDAAEIVEWLRQKKQKPNRRNIKNDDRLARYECSDYKELGLKIPVLSPHNSIIV